MFSFESSIEHYTADAFVVRCFDDRFLAASDAFLAKLNIGHKDPESVAGGATIFSSPESPGDADFMLRELGKSIRLHHTTKAKLFVHHDCGAHGGFGRFENDPAKELSFFQEEYPKIVAAIHDKYPDIEIEMYFIDEQGVIQIS